MNSHGEGIFVLIIRKAALKIFCILLLFGNVATVGYGLLLKTGSGDGGTPIFFVSGTEGESFIILNSSNLFVWEPVFGGIVSNQPNWYLMINDKSTDKMFYRAVRGQSQFSIQLSPLVRGNPFSQLQVLVQGASTESNVFIGYFYNTNGFYASVPAFSIDEDVVEVTAPPVLNMNTGELMDSTVSLYLSTGTGTNKAVSQVVHGIVITNYTSSYPPAGEIALAYLDHLRKYAGKLEKDAATSPVTNLASLGTNLVSYSNALARVIDSIRTARTNPAGCELGYLDGRKIVLTTNTLAALDKQIIELLRSVNSAIESSTISAQSQIRKNDAESPADDYIKALLRNPEDAYHAYTNYARWYTKSSVEAVTKGLQVALGSAAIATSLGAIGGIGAAALAEVNSVVLFLTAEATAGLTAVGAALGKTNAVGAAAVQSGLNYFNDFVSTPINAFMDKITGHVAGVIRGVSQLIDAFSSTPIEVDPIQVTPPDQYVGTLGGCSGGTVTTSIRITAPQGIHWEIEVFNHPLELITISANPVSGNGSQVITLTLTARPQTPTSGHTCSDVSIWEDGEVVLISFFYEDEWIGTTAVLVRFDFIEVW